MMSSFRQLTVGSCSRPAVDGEEPQPSAAAAAGAGEFSLLIHVYFLSV